MAGAAKGLPQAIPAGGARSAGRFFAVSPYQTNKVTSRSWYQPDNACGVMCSCKGWGRERERGRSTSSPGTRNKVRPVHRPPSPYQHCQEQNRQVSPFWFHFIPRPFFTLSATPTCALSVGRYPATLAVSVGPTSRPRPVRVARRPMAPHEREGHQLRSGLLGFACRTIWSPVQTLE